GVPPQGVGTVNAALKDVLAQPDGKRRLLEMGIEARPSTPDKLMTLYKADLKKWDDVIVNAGIEKKKRKCPSAPSRSSGPALGASRPPAPGGRSAATCRSTSRRAVLRASAPASR